MSILFAQRLSDGLQVVIKSREKASSFSGDAEEREWRQTTLRQLGLPPIEATCRYLAVYETEEFYHVVMERASGLDLQRWTHLTQVSLDATKEIVHQILRSLRAMHSCGRIHRDLKLANVMVDFNSTRQRRRSSAGGVARASSTGIEARLIDFDTALDWDPLAPASTRVVGTDGYMAPEAYAGKFSPASDMYSVGVILYRLLTGQAPFRSKIFHDDDDGPGDNHAGSPSTRRLERRLKREKVDFACFPLGQCSEAQDLVRRLLAVAPEERPSAEEALQHAWFQAEREQEAPTSPAATRKRFSLRGNTGGAWRPSGGNALVLPAVPPVLLGAGGPPGSIGSHVQLHQQKLRAV